jgi:hypothetical protein
MRLTTKELGKNPKDAPLREAWIVSCGDGPGRISPRRTRTWKITSEDVITPAQYEALNEDIMAYARTLKEQPRVRWVRVEWNGFDAVEFAQAERQRLGDAS